MYGSGKKANSKFTFQNDDGGGLICDNVLFGVVSRAGCAVANFPAIYTDVAVYNTWIDSILNWNDGEHEIVPTPTTITPAPTTPVPGGAAIIVKSMYLFGVCMTVLLLR